MNKVQLNNLIRFAFCMKNCSNIDNNSPDYILEKFRRYLGNPELKSVINDPYDNDFISWANKWRISSIDNTEYRNVFLLTKQLSLNVSLSNFRPSNFIKAYDIYFERSSFNNEGPLLHHLLEIKIGEVMKIKEIIRDYKLCILI